MLIYILIAISAGAHNMGNVFVVAKYHNNSECVTTAAQLSKVLSTPLTYFACISAPQALN